MPCGIRLARFAPVITRHPASCLLCRYRHKRHSTASLLMMNGANPAAVQRILRHSDPKLTTEVYGHPGAGVPARRGGPALVWPRGDQVCYALATERADGTKEGRNPERESPGVPAVKSGAGNRIRTGDPQLGKLMLYQLSYSREVLGRSAPSQPIRQAGRGPWVA